MNKYLGKYSCKPTQGKKKDIPVYVENNNIVIQTFLKTKLWPIWLGDEFYQIHKNGISIPQIFSGSREGTIS